MTDYVSTETNTKLGSDGTLSLAFSTELKTGLVAYLTLQPRDPASSQFVQAFKELAERTINTTCIAEEQFGPDSYTLQLQHAGTNRTVTLRVIYGGNQFSAKAVTEKAQKVSRDGSIGEVVSRMLVHLEGAAKQSKTTRIKRPYAGAVSSDEPYADLESQFED